MNFLGLHSIGGVKVFFSPYLPEDALLPFGAWSYMARDAESVRNVIDWANEIKRLWPHGRAV